MALINWSEALEVHIEEIDNQHRFLVELVNRLHDSMKTGSGNSILGPIFRSLLDYVNIHFETEEKLMRQHDYPAYAQHKLEHDELTKKAKDLEKSFQAGKLTITIEVMNFLKDWLKNHILASDQKYAPFFAQRGLR
jgi:hemerythrin